MPSPTHMLESVDVTGQSSLMFQSAFCVPTLHCPSRCHTPFSYAVKHQSLLLCLFPSAKPPTEDVRCRSVHTFCCRLLYSSTKLTQTHSHVNRKRAFSSQGSEVGRGPLATAYLVAYEPPPLVSHPQQTAPFEWRYLRFAKFNEQHSLSAHTLSHTHTHTFTHTHTHTFMG
jgi:hypothetical protein